MVRIVPRLGTDRIGAWWKYSWPGDQILVVTGKEEEICIK
jgi:hypothetical protein